MIQENLGFLLQLYVRPVAVISAIIDRGNWLFGALGVVVVSAMLQFGITGNLYRSYQSPPVTYAPRAHTGPPHTPPAATPEDEEIEYIPPQPVPLPLVGHYGWWFVSFSTASVLGSVVALALLYVPFTLFVITLLEDLGSFSVILQKDYGALLTCTLTVWTAAHLPFALAGLGLETLRPSPLLMLALWAAAKLYFAVLMVFVLRTIFGAGLKNSLATVSVAWVSTVFESYLGWLASPFILYFAYYYFRSDVGDIFSTFRTRQSFRRYLEASTVNPRDAEAHYQLGLIHLQRRQYTEAIERFRRAVEIAPQEPDAHYQLGQIARRQSRFDDAIQSFQTVIALDPQHAQHEVWRELGGTYAAASRFPEARAALEKYVDRRSYDPEGLYYLGETLARLGEPQTAREMFERAVEAVNTNPYTRHGHIRKWRKLAEKQLRSLCK
jgi:tetratricopeptide (TPR) repeat protein